MTQRESPLYWALSCGILAGTQIRVSLFFPLVMIALCLRNNLQVGLILSAILFVSVLFHEFGHVVAARMTGGSANEILVWPLGGLAMVQPAQHFQSRFITAAAGPFINFTICMITFPAVLQHHDVSSILFPFKHLPTIDLSNQLIFSLLILIFIVNWVLFVVSLFPVYPLDGGRMLQVLLANHWSYESSTEIYLRIGFIFSLILMFVGLIFDGENFPGTWLACIGAIALVLNMRESFLMQTSENYDESFMGYDFSAGYTSLERSEEEESKQTVGFFELWRKRRAEQRTRKEIQKQKEVEQQMDEILEKVHKMGFESLSDSEKKILKQASEQLRNKGNEPAT